MLCHHLVSAFIKEQNTHTFAISFAPYVKRVIDDYYEKQRKFASTWPNYTKFQVYWNINRRSIVLFRKKVEIFCNVFIFIVLYFAHHYNWNTFTFTFTPITHANVCIRTMCSLLADRFENWLGVIKKSGIVSRSLQKSWSQHERKTTAKENVEWSEQQQSERHAARTHTSIFLCLFNVNATYFCYRVIDTVRFG